MDDDLNTSSIRSTVLRTTLDEVANHSHEVEGDRRPDCCVICLEYISEQAQAQPCSHASFDFLCLVSWLQERARCPLCNSNVNTVLYDLKSGKPKTYTVPLQEKAGSTTTLRRGATNRARNRSSYPYRQPDRGQGTQTVNEVIAQRRSIYRNKQYSLHVGSNRLSRFRDLTPQLFSSDTELISRARKWIRRELQVFEFLQSGPTAPANNDRRAKNAEFLLEYIIAILKTVDIQGAGGQAEEMIQEFLGRDNTRLFLHELRAWLRSPYINLEDWDRAVQYALVPKDIVLPSAVSSPEEMPGSSRASSPRHAPRDRRHIQYRRRPYMRNGGRNDGFQNARLRYNPD